MRSAVKKTVDEHIKELGLPQLRFDTEPISQYNIYVHSYCNCSTFWTVTTQRLYPLQ